MGDVQLVERLKQVAEALEHDPWARDEGYDRVVRDAAAEIERMEGENERLRWALRQVAVYDQDERPLPGDDSPFDWRRRSEKQERMARDGLAALARKGADRE